MTYEFLQPVPICLMILLTGYWALSFPSLRVNVVRRGSGIFYDDSFVGFVCPAGFVWCPCSTTTATVLRIPSLAMMTVSGVVETIQNDPLVFDGSLGRTRAPDKWLKRANHLARQQLRIHPVRKLG